MNQSQKIELKKDLTALMEKYQVEDAFILLQYQEELSTHRITADELDSQAINIIDDAAQMMLKQLAGHPTRM